ncbi:MAG TPA: hypothetical protein VLA59_01965 [Patescibacteria group bacterium]|nr:hypothetical protein [Patescibacteria group bacterium]
MSRSTFELIRWPVAIGLLLIAAFVLFPRGDDDASADATPTPSVIVGEVGGEILTPTPEPTAPPEATPIPTLSPAPTPRPTPEPTATPVPQADGFTAEVLACRSISGSECNGQLGTLPADAGAFTALVRFTDANAGDQMNAILDGPSGTIDGFPYSLQGGGDGYYYTQFQAGGLPAGEYTLTATRNGEPVAVTTFTKAG